MLRVGENKVAAETEPEIKAGSSIAEEPYPKTGYAWYVVGVLTLVYVFSFIDRQILNLLVRSIRRDLGITETEMSLLQGFSFAVFYTFFGVLLGKLADTRSRRGLIAAGFVFWSVMTAGCGVAKNFFQMLLFRMGVGVGEASLSPAAYSLITDYFPKERRATAISVYSMGIYIGSGLALVLGGWVISLVGSRENFDLPLVGETRSWQVIFFIVGLPGVLLALLMYTVREPLRRGLRLVKSADGTLKKAGVSTREAYSYMLQNRTTFLCHTIGFALLSFSSYGASAWIPTFYQRVHGWSQAKSGIVYGLIIGIASTLGVVAGGRLADYLTQRGRRNATMFVGLLVSVAWFPFGMVYPMMSDAAWVTVFLIPAAFLASAPFGVAPAAIQQIMPNEMRGQASAVYLFVVNLIGLGIGPTAVAVTTQVIFRDDNMIHYSLLVVGTLAHIVSTLLLWCGLKPFNQSLDRLKQWTATNP
jgi:MFS family permease